LNGGETGIETDLPTEADQRSDLNAARNSLVKSSGCSQIHPDQAEYTVTAAE
jgi:hypothetical protein